MSAFFLYHLLPHIIFLMPRFAPIPSLQILKLWFVNECAKRQTTFDIFRKNNFFLIFLEFGSPAGKALAGLCLASGCLFIVNFFVTLCTMRKWWMFRGILSENARKWSSRARVELYRYLAKDTGLWLPLHCQIFVTLCTMRKWWMFRCILSVKRAKMVLPCVELYRYLAKDTGLWLPLHCQIFVTLCTMRKWWMFRSILSENTRKW